MSGAPRPVILAAGGTGGHMFPAEALAAELHARGRRTVLITDSRGAGFGDTAGATEIHRIAARSPGGGIGSRARGVATLFMGWLQARRLLARISPAAAVGFGGYPSVPTMFAAARAGLPTMIHEQNAVLGRANAVLAARVDVIATSFASVAGLRAGDERKAVRTGNPVRPAAAALGVSPYARPDTDRLLIIGGSQGARILSDVVPAAIALLPEAARARLSIVQQARPEDCDRVVEAYRQLALEADVKSFFDDLPARIAAATLVVARAGASTITELTAIGRPAILVPYRFAADDHQLANARALEREAAAWVMPETEFTASALAKRLASLLGDADALAKAAGAARAMAMPDAASRLADEVERIARGNGFAPPGQARVQVGSRAA